MHVIDQAVIRPHVLRLPALSLAAKFGAFAAKVLAWAVVDAGAPAADRAAAIVGWFAAHAVHPQPFLHPNGTSLNTGVLPAGETWATFNTLFGATARTNSDTDYWYGLFPNGVTMLEALIGTTSSGGVQTDNGMLTEYAAGQWRIRSFAGFRSVQCTLQCKMAQVVLAAIGIPSVDLSTVGHDPMAFYDIEAGRWTYIDPTFGETLTLIGQPQTPLGLLTTCLDGYSALIASTKLPGAGYIPVGYFTAPNFTAGGMSVMTVHTSPQWAGGLSARAPYRFGDLPSQSPAQDRCGTMTQILPMLGVGIAGLQRIGRTVEIRLRSSWPGHVGFERSTNDGVTWAACGAIDYRAIDSGGVRYRSVDAAGFAGTPAAAVI